MDLDIPRAQRGTLYMTVSNGGLAKVIRVASLTKAYESKKGTRTFFFQFLHVLSHSPIEA